jgi:hypothetical protein
MSLTTRVLNGDRLAALCVPEEVMEVQSVLLGARIVNQGAIGPVKLKRTFNQGFPDGTLVKFWRIMGPATHPNYGSDLSIEGLKQWRII